MIVVSSGQLAGTSSKPVMMSLSAGQGGIKTVSVRGGQGGNQILSLPSGMAGQILTMMFGGKQVAVLTSGAASQIGGKAVQLFFAGGQQTVTNSDGLVTSEAALAQLAGESGLVEGEGR